MCFFQRAINVILDYGYNNKLIPIQFKKQTLKKNCLSVFDDFVRLALKELSCFQMLSNVLLKNDHIHNLKVH